MQSGKTVLALIVAAIAVLIMLLAWPERGGNGQGAGNGEEGKGGEPLVLHCAAGLRLPVSEIAEAYERETGRKVRLNYGPSGALEATLEVAGGDLYLPADASYIDSTRSKGLIDEALPVAYLTAGIAVVKGNPLGIDSLDALSARGRKVVLANPEAAVGVFTRKVLEAAGVAEAVAANVIVTKPTVNEVAETVELGLADAGIIWDALALQYANVDFVHVPEFDARRKQATVAVLRSAPDPSRALHFARFLAASDRGQPVFSRHGYAVPERADKWADVPQIAFFSGSMLRPAIEERLAAFEKREGVEIATIYEGCGTLVAQMESGARPDAYFSCDVKFLDMVQDRFAPGTVVARNDMVILVHAGNPTVRSLGDLAAPGLQVGIAHPEKSALGDLTVNLLQRAGIYPALEASGNIVLFASKGDELVNQVQVGALDAAIVYRSNANASPGIAETCDIVEIGATGEGAAFATQPFAVSKGSDFPQLMNRLREALTDKAGKAAFLKFGFHWELDKGTTPP